MSPPQVIGVVRAYQGPDDAAPQGTDPLPRTASYSASFQQQQQQGQSLVSRDHLIEQGMPPQQADALITQAHEEEVLLRHFRRWIHFFSLMVCILTPAMIGIMIWMIIEYVSHRSTKCSVPLQTWVYVVCLTVIFNSTCNRQTPTGSCVQRVFCQWTRDPQNPQLLPVRIWLYNLLVTLFISAWNALGLFWVFFDGRDEGTDAPPCKDVAYGLWKSVQVYSSFNLAFTVFMYINMVGFSRLLRVAMRRGLLRTSNAAPPGSLEKNTEAVSANDPLLTQHPSCSICLEDFGVGNKPITKTKTCQHVFHRQCLQGWLQVNRTCPLCREDLAVPAGG